MLSACSEETGFSATDTGTVRLSLDVDRTVLTAGASRSSLDEIVANLAPADFTVRLTGADGESKEWPFATFTGDKIGIGSYTITAYSGTEGKEGFNAAYFAGSEKINVATDLTTEVAITTRLANSAVRVDYTDEFRAYMSTFSASVRTAGSVDGIEYPATTTSDDMFINPGDASLYVTFTTNTGKSATLKAAEFTAAAQHRYTITVDINEGQMGDAVLNVEFDDQTVAETREFVLSDELFNAPAPVVTPENLATTVVESYSPAQECRFNVVAQGRVAAITLVTESEYLLSQGWPAQINLMDAGADVQQLLRSLGADVRGVWGKANPNLAVVDLSGTASALRPADNNVSRFRLEVEDEYGKVSDPSGIIEVTLIPLELEILDQQLCMLGDTKATIELAYNGEDLSKAVYEVYNDGAGEWETVTPISINPVSRSRASEDTPVYAVTLPLHDGLTNAQVRVHVLDRVVDFEIVRGVPEYTMSVDPVNVYATYAYAEIQSDDVDPASLVAVLKFTATGADALKVQHLGDGLLKVSGLKPSTAVDLKASVSDKVAEAKFTTEAAAAVPNGDFESLGEPFTASMNQSGKWSISAGINYQTTTQYSISEPTGWATVNKKTAGDHTTNNSWFRVPSTVNTTLTWTSTVPAIKLINTGGGTDTPPAVKGLVAQNGSNAMLLRNVGWSANGSVPGVKVEYGGTDAYYNHTAADLDNRSAGKLFLGSYSYSGGTETYNEGVSFTSRPVSLSGYYKYERDDVDAEETGIVTVQVLSGSTVIASATVNLEPASDYTLFTVPLTYKVGAPKATQVRVMFASSNHASYSQAAESAAVKTSDRMNRYECYALGSALTVDNLSFNY